MWAQPDAGVPVPLGLQTPVAPAPDTRGTRAVNAVFGRVPTPGKVVFNLVFWSAAFAYFMFRGAPLWLFILAIVGVGMSLANVVRWYRHRP
jgi:hypothetical protein